MDEIICQHVLGYPTDLLVRYSGHGLAHIKLVGNEVEVVGVVSFQMVMITHFSRVKDGVMLMSSM